MAVLTNHRFCVAPMMRHTDRHFRYLLRLMSRRAMLYTEMIVCDAILRGDRRRILAFHPSEHPLGLQLGGSDPAKMAPAARLAESCGYDEININVGCPSPRVSAGAFGACLMKEPERLAECIAAMRECVTIPVTVKCRIGVDEQNAYSDFQTFVAAIASAGCQIFIVHARQAWLKGLSPKENRSVPELRYDYVHQLKRDFPNLQIILNGGLLSLEQAQSQMKGLDGVMLGRAICKDPLLMLQVDSQFYDEHSATASAQEITAAYLAYALAYAKEQGIMPLRLLLRHLPNLHRAKPGAKDWRRFWGDVMNGKAQSLLSIIENANARFPLLIDAQRGTR